MKYESLTADKFYHIYNRGNNREHLFFEERNFEYFLLLVAKHLLPVAEIYAYCLLENHFHLLIKTKDAKEDKLISRAFSNLFNAYSKAINKSYNRRGSLFQDRFKRIVVEDEEYLKTLLLYIHLNPKRHKLIEDFSKYEYSSYQSLIKTHPSFLQKEDVLELFGGQDNFIYCHFQRQDEILEKDKSQFLE